MLNINNQAFVSLKIDGTELEYANIKNITIAEGNGTMIPTIKIELDDPKSYLSKSHALSEGNTIELLIARSLKDNKSVARKYRVFGLTRENASYNSNIAIVGMLNAPLYISASARESYVGTSGSTLSAVAAKCGLKYSGPSMGRTLNDKQIWLDVTTTRSKFVFDVSRHGWMDSKSCMSSVVTSYGELRYRNIVDEINTPVGNIKFILTHSTYETGSDSKTHYIVKEARDKSSAGVMATWTNYGATLSTNNIDGVQRNTKDLQVQSPGKALALNKEVMDLVKRSRIEYSALDSTNTHKEYQNAIYQNVKISALFTESMSLLITDVSDIQLFDVLIYRQADADPKSKVRNEDKYLVTGKTIVIRGGIHYAERLQCSRMSLTMTGQAPMATSMKDTSTPSLVPESSINVKAIGSGLAALNGIKSLAGSLDFLGDISVMLGNGTFGSINALADVFDGVANVKNLMGMIGVPDLSIISAIGSLARAVEIGGAATEFISSASSILANATSTAVNNLSPASQALRMAESQAATAYAAAEIANNEIKEANETMVVMQKLSKLAEAAGVAAKPGPAKVAAQAKAAEAAAAYERAAKNVVAVAADQQQAIRNAEVARTGVSIVQSLSPVASGPTTAAPTPAAVAAEAALVRATPVLTAGAAASATIATAADAASAAHKAWKDLQAKVAAAPQGPARAALIAETQAAYNTYYAKACTATDVELANKAAVEAAARVKAEIEAQRVRDDATLKTQTAASEALAKAALSKPGGCVDAINNTVKAVAANKEASVEVWALVGSTPTKYMVSPEMKKLMEKQTLADDKCKLIMADGVAAANLVMSAVHGVPVPSPLPVGNSSAMATLTTLISKPGVTASQISQAMASIIAKEKSGSPAWLYYNNIASAWGNKTIAAGIS